MKILTPDSAALLLAETVLACIAKYNQDPPTGLPRLSMDEACERTAGPLAEAVILMFSYSWSGTEAWATELVKKNTP